MFGSRYSTLLIPVTQLLAYGRGGAPQVVCYRGEGRRSNGATKNFELVELRPIGRPPPRRDAAHRLSRSRLDSLPSAHWAAAWLLGLRVPAIAAMDEACTGWGELRYFSGREGKGPEEDRRALLPKDSRRRGPEFMRGWTDSEPARECTRVHIAGGKNRSGGAEGGPPSNCPTPRVTTPSLVGRAFPGSEEARGRWERWRRWRPCCPRTGGCDSPQSADEVNVDASVFLQTVHAIAASRAEGAPSPRCRPPAHAVRLITFALLRFRRRKKST